MIVLRDVAISIEKTPIVSGVSHRIKPGSWCALVGPNGAGKTTLLRAIAGLSPYQGSLQISGAEIATLSTRHRAHRIAFVPQNPAIPPMMTVFDYVLLGRTPHISLLGRENHRDRDIVADVLRSLSLTAFAQRPLTDISGGELQRVVLARALAQQAEMLILDEPTAALDLGQQQRVLELVDELRWHRGLTILSAIHDLTLVGQYADDVMLMAGGGLVAAGSPEQVLTAATIQTHYGAQVEIISGPGGSAIIPQRQQPQRPSRPTTASPELAAPIAGVEAQLPRQRA